MIHSETSQDVFSAVESFREGGKTVVFLHGCNAQGVMGAGVARELAARYPAAYSRYRTECLTTADEDLVGTVVPVWVDKDLLVLNAITQRFYGRKGGATSDWISSCLKTVSEEFPTFSSDTVFITVPVGCGCGLGGLDWEADVLHLFENSPLPWRVYRLG